MGIISKFIYLPTMSLFLLLNSAIKRNRLDEICLLSSRTADFSIKPCLNKKKVMNICENVIIIMLVFFFNARIQSVTLKKMVESNDNPCRKTDYFCRLQKIILGSKYSGCLIRIEENCILYFP